MALAPLKLNRLQRFDKLVDDTGVSTQFQTLWQRTVTALEENNGELIDALVLIASLQSAVAGKNAIFVQTGAPTATGVNDLWIDSDDGNKPYRWDGATWVAVQDIGAALALGSINLDGTISTGKVITDSITANAVSNTGFAFTATPTLISTSYSDVQTLVVTADGVTPVNISFGLAFYWDSDNGRGEFALYRDATALAPFDPNTINSNENPVYSSEYSDTPAAGTYTYYLKAKANNVNKIGVKNTYIRQMELMR